MKPLRASMPLGSSSALRNTSPKRESDRFCSSDTPAPLQKSRKCGMPISPSSLQKRWKMCITTFSAAGVSLAERWSDTLGLASRGAVVSRWILRDKRTVSAVLMPICVRLRLFCSGLQTLPATASRNTAGEKPRNSASTPRISDTVAAPGSRRRNLAGGAGLSETMAGGSFSLPPLKCLAGMLHENETTRGEPRDARLPCGRTPDSATPVSSASRSSWSAATRQRPAIDQRPSSTASRRRRTMELTNSARTASGLASLFSDSNAGLN
mmetsp:Transcript_267/g.811  ORF Transcript_267/g.811 Transcript_267/m.811 type:complete len:267 (+) Transcript_267:6722-7522(+)